MEVRHEYVPMRRRRDDMRGYSEEQLKRRLERQGWIVCRGDLLCITRNKGPDDLYPSVARKYGTLLRHLAADFPEHVELLQYLCAVHHGIPDYLCYRETLGRREWKFVECKLIYEQLLPGQKACIPKLQAMGFAVEVQKLVDHRTKTRRADVDLSSGAKRVTEKQMKLPRRTKKWALGGASIKSGAAP